MDVRLPFGFSPVTAIKDVAKIAATGPVGSVYNGVTNGNWGDVTPGYGVVNTSRTQLDKHVLGANTSINNNAGTSRPTGNDSSSSGTGGTVYNGGGGGTGGGLTAAQIAANRQAEAVANAALGRLPTYLQNAQNQVQNTYDQNFNELTSGRNAAQQNYDQTTQQNQQQYVSNKNQINDQASQGLRSLLRMLGQHGAGGSSAALYAAPNAVAQLATQQRSGAGQTFGQNQQGLDTNWNNYLTGFDNSKRQLADWRTQQLQNAQSNVEQNRQSLLAQLAQLQQTPDAAQPYIDQINASADKVAQLGNFNPTYTGKSPVFNAPDVQSYTVDQTGAPVFGVYGNGTGGSATPALAYLLGLNKDRQQQQLVA